MNAAPQFVGAAAFQGTFAGRACMDAAEKIRHVGVFLSFRTSIANPRSRATIQALRV